MSFLNEVWQQSKTPKSFVTVPLIVLGVIVVGGLLLFVAGVMITPFMYAVF
jgi:hypothetical protein